jgi:hypothetical protein
MAADHARVDIAAQSSRPLVGIFIEDDSDEVRYFLDDQETATAQPSPDALAALAVIGAWNDLDWDELAEDLDRIRHESPPTPPIDLDDV